MIVNEVISKFIDILRASNNSLSGIIMSAPGNMKTGTLHLYAKAYGLRLVTLIPSQYSFDEVLGFQKIDENDPQRTLRTKPDWYDKMMKYPDDEWILFVDEISTANPYIQGGLLNLIMNKTLGSGMYLPKKTTIVAAGNYSDNLNDEFQMNSALVNRFLILNLNRIEYSDKDLYVIENSDLFYDKYMSPNYTDLEEIKKFCGLNDRRTYGEDIVDKLMKVVKGRILMNRPDLIKNSTEDGLIGFTSPRTIVYVKKLLKIANSLGLLDKSILQIISDTCGITRISESYMYSVLESCYETYINTYNKVTKKFDIKSLDDLGKDEKKWIEYIDSLIDNYTYKEPNFTDTYLVPIRSKIFEIFPNNLKDSEIYKKLAQLARISASSLEKD